MAASYNFLSPDGSSVTQLNNAFPPFSLLYSTMTVGRVMSFRQLIQLSVIDSVEGMNCVNGFS
jgi:hypothetical protein